MSHDDLGNAVLVPLLLETALFGWLALVLAGTFTGHATTFAGVAPWLRLLALVLVVAFGVAPLWVYYDVRRAEDSTEWVHIAILPLVNLVGLAAYLHHRRQRSEEPSGTGQSADE